MRKPAIVISLIFIVVLLVYLIAVLEPSGFVRGYLIVLIDLIVLDFFDKNRMAYPLLMLLLLIYPVLNLLVILGSRDK